MYVFHLHHVGAINFNLVASSGSLMAGTVPYQLGAGDITLIV